MKRTYIILLVVLLIGIMTINKVFKLETIVTSPLTIKLATPVNEAFIDDNFYKCVVDMYNQKHNTSLEYDENLSDEELATINTLDCSNRKISSTKGIEKLLGLEYVDLSNNKITFIDLYDLHLNNNSEMGNDNPIIDIGGNKCSIGNVNICEQNIDTTFETENNIGFFNLSAFGMEGEQLLRVLNITDDVEYENGVFTFNPKLQQINYLYNSQYTIPGTQGEKLMLQVTLNIANNNEIINNFGNLTIRKFDSEKELLLENAVFQICPQNDSNNCITRSTNANGTIYIENLEYNTYIVKEIKAPEGYQLDDNDQIVTINSDKPDPLLIFKNKKINPVDEEIKYGSITITKVDDNDKPLKGAIFGLFDKKDYNKESKPIMEKVSDNNGKIIFNDLKPGEYIVKETEAPEGFKIDTNEYMFSITDDELNVEKTIKNILIDDVDKPLAESPDTGIKYYIVIPILSIIIGLICYNNVSKKNKFNLSK